jgi:NADH-quinone oxidoreductase subunit M
LTGAKNKGLPDLNLREWAVMAPLMAWAVWIGVYPKPFFDILEKPVTQLVERVRPDYFHAPAQANLLPGYPSRSRP